MEEVLLKFLKWMDKTQQSEQMKLETDNTDIMMCFLEEYPQYKSSHKISCAWCGSSSNDKGKIITKIIHQECYEALLNGAGMFE